MKHKPLSFFKRVKNAERSLTPLVLLFVLWASLATSTIAAAVELEPQPRLFIDTNGVTIKCENCETGDAGTLEGSSDITVYTVVDNEALRDAVANGYDLSKLCTSLVTDLSSVFKSANFFNQDISRWDVSNVTNMTEAFMYATAFNQDIGDWDVSSVVDMSRMFMNASKFNQDLNQWDVSRVKNMSDMFGQASLFNGDIGDWNVSSVTNMTYMFILAEQFNQDISEWCVTNITSEPTQFSSGSSLSTLNKPNWGECPRGDIIASNISKAHSGASEIDGTIAFSLVDKQIYMQGFANGVLYYSIVDVCGRSIVNSQEIVITEHQGQINTNSYNLKQGIYLLQLYSRDSKASITIKFIKN